MSARRWGGIAALVGALTFVFGIVMFVTVMADYTTDDPSAAASVEFVRDHEASLIVWYSVIYLLFGIALVGIVLALRELLGSQFAASVATAFGTIWAGLMFAAGMVANIGVGTVIDVADTDPDRAETVWLTWDSVLNGLGGGNEIVGGLWVLVLSRVALHTDVLPGALNWLGIVCGVAGVVTIVPALAVVGAVFGIGLIVWFAWLGISLLRSETTADAVRTPRTPSRLGTA